MEQRHAGGGSGGREALDSLGPAERLTDPALAHLPIHRFLEELLERLRSTLGVDAVMVHAISDDRSLLIRRAASSAVVLDRELARIPFGAGLVGRIASSGFPADVGGLEREPEPPAPLESGSVPLVPPDAPLRAQVGVPLVVDGGVIGVLSVFSRAPCRLTREGRRLLEVAADRVAPSLDRARLLENWRAERERLEALSRNLVLLLEEERSRVAREVHDEIGQLLTSLRLALRAGPDSTGAAQGILDDLFARVRGISMSLRPPMLDDLGLAPTLLWHCERFTAQTGVRVELRESGLDRRFGREAELAVYRIIQEALTNVARHAEAQDARVIVEGAHDRLRARVVDLGIGFHATGAPPALSSGLTGMRERARSLGGRLVVTSQPGAGTIVSVWIPVETNVSPPSPEVIP